MTTIADFRTSVSQMSLEELLGSIRDIRRLRRMIPERKIRVTKKRTAKTSNVQKYLDNLGTDENRKLLELLLKLKKGT